MDKQKAMLQALWRKAAKQDAPLEIDCKDAASATRFRFALYNAVKEARKDTAMIDSELREAVALCSIGFKEGSGKSIVVLQQKIMTNMMQAVADALGDTPIIDATEAAAQAALAHTIEALAQPEPARRATPYYTRNPPQE